MRFTPLVTLAALAMAASWFLPWIAGPFGQSLVPHDAIYEGLREDPAGLPLELLVFVASFAVAALLALLALFNSAPRGLAWLAALIPAGLVVRIAIGLRDSVEDIGLPMPALDTVAEAMDYAKEFFDLGAWMYLGGAGVLLILAIIDPGVRRR